MHGKRPNKPKSYCTAQSLEGTFAYLSQFTGTKYISNHEGKLYDPLEGTNKRLKHRSTRNAKSIKNEQKGKPQKLQRRRQEHPQTKPIPQSDARRIPPLD